MAQMPQAGRAVISIRAAFTSEGNPHFHVPAVVASFLLGDGEECGGGDSSLVAFAP